MAERLSLLQHLEARMKKDSRSDLLGDRASSDMHSSHDRTEISQDVVLPVDIFRHLLTQNFLSLNVIHSQMNERLLICDSEEMRSSRALKCQILGIGNSNVAKSLCVVCKPKVWISVNFNLKLLGFHSLPVSSSIYYSAQARGCGFKRGSLLPL